MYNLYFPICAFMISVLIVLAFFTKNGIKNSETNCYARLILIGFAESSLACVIVVMALVFGTLNIAYFTNRLDYLLILFWIWTLFGYVISISTENKSAVNKIKKITLIINIIVSFLILFVLKINLINENGVIDTSGPATDLMTLMAVVYLISIIISFVFSIIKQKNNRNKFLPMIILIILFTLMVIIRSIKPEIVLLSYIISYIDLIMFFTIENPDKKLVEEIVKSKEIADSSNAEKTFFLFNMSQEIKQPIMNIKMMLSEISNESKEENTKENVRRIEESVSQMYNVINGVLDISSMDAHNIDTVNDKYSIELLLKEIIGRVQQKINKDKIEFRTSIDKNLPSKLYGDSIRIKQVLNTILNNSIKYTETGFIELNISKVIKNNVCRLLFEIEDSGSGIVTEKFESLFNRDKRENELNLIQENNSDELNLVNVRKLLNIMGGTILINSQLNTGTKITIVLDQKIAELDSDEQVSEVVQKFQKIYTNKKVLIVDDKEASIMLLSKILAKYKIDTEYVMTLKETIDTLEKHNDYSLVLIDDTLEKYTGLQVLEKIKTINGYKIPTIIISRKSKIQYFDEYIKVGFLDYIEKPIEKKEIERVLNKFFKK